MRANVLGLACLAAASVLLITAPATALPAASCAGGTGSCVDSNQHIEFDVQGQPALRIAPPNGACNGAAEGAIRYDISTRSFLACDGAVWKPMSIKFGATTQYGPNWTRREGGVIPVWRSGAQVLDCPPGSVLTGIVVNTSGTCWNQCDADGPIIQSINIRCTTLTQ